MGGGIVIVIMLAIGIDEMGIRAAKLLCGLVHKIYKRFHTAADMFADGIAAFTAGAHQQTVEGLFHRDRFTGFDADVGITSPVDAVHRGIGIFDHLI